MKAGTSPLAGGQDGGLHGQARPLLTSNRIGFERIGHHGEMYLNRDGTYAILQVDPDRQVSVFHGRWRAVGATGFEMIPVGSATGPKSFAEMPTAFDDPRVVRNDLGEDYLITLRRGR